jgi:eukaryotic-like serine/threonine-protein kinase
MLESGRQFGHYSIQSRLGAGGMGEVYLAQDTRLNRKVALKILPENISGDTDRLRRFEQEAHSASALNHPNILTIYEFGSEEDTHFLAAEFVEGKTLRERLKGSPVSLRAALEIAVQVASALDAAHRAGIVHRDIKPENVMIRDDDGLIKLLDFGIAKLTEKLGETDSEAATEIKVQTNPGVIMGTASYMSPEQARGKPVDGRSDIFSLGVVFYEMLAGKPPFEGETSIEVIASILSKEPTPISQLIPGIPHEIERIINTTLRKDPDERFQTARDLLIDLRDVRQEFEFQNKLGRNAQANAEASKTQILNVTTGGNAHKTSSEAEYVGTGIRRQNRVFFAGLLVLMVLAAGLGYWFFSIRGDKPPNIESIAVMPFVNEGGNAENEYLSDGMTESLISSLSQIPRLSVKARNSVFRYKGKDINPRRVADELSVQALLLGRIVQRGGQLVLNLELVDPRSENVIWSGQYTRKQSDLVSLQAEIARDVSNKLKTKLTGAEEKKIAKNYTENPEAYQLYLKGRYHWNKRTGADVRKSVEYFQQAIDKDPTYALAYAGLADAYILIPVYTLDSPHENFSRARAAATKALETDETLAEAHAALASIKSDYDWNFAEAEREFKRSIELNPNYATARHWYAEYLLSMNRKDEALAEIKRAQELDPLSLIINSVTGLVFREKGDYDKAVEQLKKTIEMDPNFSRAHLFLAETYEQMGLFEEAIAEYEKHSILIGMPPEQVAKELKEVKEAYKNGGAKGYWKKLAELYERFRVSRPNIPPPPLPVMAGIYVRLGENDRALALLEKEYEQRSSNLGRVQSSVFDPIRPDPRFQDLMRRVGLPQ